MKVRIFPLIIINMKYRNIKIHTTKINNNSDKNLIVLHGYGSNSTNHVNKIKLILRDHNIHGIDFVGHGKSEFDANLLDPLEFVEIVRRYIQKNKLKNITIYAHSMGAGVASFFYNHPDVDRFFLLSPMNDSVITAKGWKAFLTKENRVKFYKFATSMFVMGRKEYKNIPKSHSRVQRVRKSVGTVGFYYTMRYRVLTNKLKSKKFIYRVMLNWSACTKKVHIIGGMNDRVITPESLRELHDIVPYSTLNLVRKAGHSIYRNNPSILKKYLIRYVRETHD